jgi:thiamine pyrophosphate-dependent acetolactate synthase large subunit-like protein
MDFKPHILSFAKSLRENGIAFAFGVTGGGPSLELITALEAEGVKYFPVAHEAAAVMMAGACSRGGKPRAVAIGIKGPGFANFIPGILSNYYEGRPAITVSEAYSPVTLISKKHKRFDHKSAVSEIVKGFYAVDGNPETVKKAIELAETEVAGPVHFDLYAEPAEAQNINHRFPGTDNTDVTIEEKILEMIKNSSKPAIILGSVALRKLKDVKWAELGIPVATTAAGKGAIDETSIFSAGVITGEVQKLSPESKILSEADLIIGIGLRNTEVINAKPYSAPLIILDCVSADLHEGYGATQKFITLDLKNAVDKCILALAEKHWREEILIAWKSELEKELFSDSWMPANVFRIIEETVNNAMLVMDTGLFCTIGETVWRAKDPQNFLGSSAGRFMGTGIPTAIGAAISSDKNIVAVMGDGGIRPYLAEIKLAVAKNLPIVFVLMSDGGYGTIAGAGKPKGFSPNAFIIKNASWKNVVDAMGCESKILNNPEELKGALSCWQRKPLFIECNFDAEKYIAMIKNLR